MGKLVSTISFACVLDRVFDLTALFISDRFGLSWSFVSESPVFLEKGWGYLFSCLPLFFFGAQFGVVSKFRLTMGTKCLGQTNYEWLLTISLLWSLWWSNWSSLFGFCAWPISNASVYCCVSYLRSEWINDKKVSLRTCSNTQCVGPFDEIRTRDLLQEIWKCGNSAYLKKMVWSDCNSDTLSIVGHWCFGMGPDRYIRVPSLRLLRAEFLALNGNEARNPLFQKFEGCLLTA